MELPSPGKSTTRTKNSSPTYSAGTKAMGLSDAEPGTRTVQSSSKTKMCEESARSQTGLVVGITLQSSKQVCNYKVPLGLCLQCNGLVRSRIRYFMSFLWLRLLFQVAQSMNSHPHTAFSLSLASWQALAAGFTPLDPYRHADSWFATKPLPVLHFDRSAI